MRVNEDPLASIVVSLWGRHRSETESGRLSTRTARPTPFYSFSFCFRTLLRELSVCEYGALRARGHGVGMLYEDGAFLREQVLISDHENVGIFKAMR